MQGAGKPAPRPSSAVTASDRAEACDDGNTVGSDGCSADCSQVEPGFTCPKTAGVGGNLHRSAHREVRRQHHPNTASSATTATPTTPTAARTSARWSPVTRAPKLAWSASASACAATALSPSTKSATTTTCWATTGAARNAPWSRTSFARSPTRLGVTTVKCGDRRSPATRPRRWEHRAGRRLRGHVSSPRRVDLPAGTFCRAAMCGDGYKAGAEQCDDHNIINGDGCSSTCTLEGAPNGQKDGWQCLTPGSPARAPTAVTASSKAPSSATILPRCPWRVLWNCQKEPSCGYDTQAVPQYGCSKVCGDGMVFPGEACDDGNIKDNDGCQADCTTVTPGWDCSPREAAAAQPTLHAIHVPRLQRSDPAVRGRSES